MTTLWDCFDSDIGAVLLLRSRLDQAEVPPIVVDLFSGSDSLRTELVGYLASRARTSELDDAVLWAAHNDSTFTAGSFPADSEAWLLANATLGPGGSPGAGGYWNINRCRLLVRGPEQPAKTPLFGDLLSALKRVSDMGFIPASVSGDTAVGLTLEECLGIPRTSKGGNNPFGIEINAGRLSKNARSGRRTLFSRVPQWGDGGRVQFLADHGAPDANGRWSLNTSVYMHRQSSAGWQLEFDMPEDRLYLTRYGQRLVGWDSHDLADKLSKHKETVFVYAEVQGNPFEKFHYVQAVHALGASFERYLRVLQDGGGCFDLVMSRTPSGGVRDHGFLFRIAEKELARLFTSLTIYDLTDTDG